MFSFQNPYLLLLLILPILYFFRSIWTQPRQTLYFPWPHKLPKFQSLRSIAAAYLPDLLLTSVMVLMVISLARPQLLHIDTERLTEGVDIILTLDTSQSMRALDFVENGKRTNRLSVVKSVAREFFDSRIDDRMGIVVFGESAYTQCPPTLDHQVLNRFMDWIEIGMVGQGTAIGSAVAVSTKRLSKLPSKSKVIILITDGRDTVQNIDPLKAAQIAATLGIKIYTIGVGSHDPVPFPVQGIFGEKVVMRRVELDENLLKEIARITGAYYFNARDTESLREIYKRIDEMEKTEVVTREYREVEERFAMFAWPAAWLLFLHLLLSQTLLRRLP